MKENIRFKTFILHVCILFRDHPHLIHHGYLALFFATLEEPT